MYLKTVAVAVIALSIVAIAAVARRTSTPPAPALRASAGSAVPPAREPRRWDEVHRPYAADDDGVPLDSPGLRAIGTQVRDALDAPSVDDAADPRPCAGPGCGAGPANPEPTPTKRWPHRATARGDGAADDHPRASIPAVARPGDRLAPDPPPVDPPPPEPARGAANAGDPRSVAPAPAARSAALGPSRHGTLRRPGHHPEPASPDGRHHAPAIARAPIEPAPAADAIPVGGAAANARAYPTVTVDLGPLGAGAWPGGLLPPPPPPPFAPEAVGVEPPAAVEGYGVVALPPPPETVVVGLPAVIRGYEGPPPPPPGGPECPPQPEGFTAVGPPPFDPIEVLGPDAPAPFD